MVFIIGSGVMGGAIAKTLAKNGNRVFVYDKNLAKAKALSSFKNISAAGNLSSLPKADFVIVAVKPQHISDLHLSGVKKSAVIISIAAGVRLGKLQKIFRHRKIVRAMPNLGLAVGQGILAWKAAGLSSGEKIGAKKLLNKIGENFEVGNEARIDAVTAISGSGPAYFFAFARSLEQAAKAAGFDSKTARKLTEKTFLAAAALQSGKSYSELISQVASKKGTTEQALKVFSDRGLNKIILKAVRAAQKRAREISRG